jgi:hypothetical protein
MPSTPLVRPSEDASTTVTVARVGPDTAGWKLCFRPCRQGGCPGGTGQRLRRLELATGQAGFNLDFHAIRHHGEDAVVVLGEEGGHGPGGLRAAGHVVLLQVRTDRGPPQATG